MVSKIWCVICRLLVLLIYAKLLSKMRKTKRGIKQPAGINLPEEILLKIFQYFPEENLRQVEQVCKQFQKVANHTWKWLYRKAFEYDQPLFKLEPGKFEFISPDKSACTNPWKESFKQLRRSVHVHRDFQNLTIRSQNFQYFDNIYDALEYVKRQNRGDSSFQSLVFLHAGTYNLDHRGAIYIENNVALVGAAPGKNVAKSVIIQGNKDIMIANEHVNRAYIGYLTLELISKYMDDQYCCLKIHGSPIVDHCIIKSFISNFSAVLVSGTQSNPLIKNCDISKCEFSGLQVSNLARGIYENNTISCNAYVGIWITDLAEPIIRRNNIHYNKGSGIYISDDGNGFFKDNNVYDNEIGFEIVHTHGEHTTIQQNKIFNDKNEDHIQKIGVYLHNCFATLENNTISNHSLYGVNISELCNPVIRNNTVKSNEIGIYVDEKGSGLLKQNYISKSTKDNVFISNSNPTLKRNHIFDGQACGISIYHNSTGNLQGNVIYDNAQMGVRICESQPILKKNKILNNGTVGVEITGNIEPTLKFNIIRFNGSNGLRLAAEMQQKLIRKGHGNKICDNNKS